MGRPASGCIIGFIEQQVAQDRRALRAHIEAFIRQGGAQQLYLVFEGAPPSTQAMQDAQLILQMLA